MMQNTEEVKVFSMKLMDNNLQFTFFFFNSVFHLCSVVTLHCRLTNRICNDRPALLFFRFLTRLASLSLSLPLWLPKSHKWGGVQTDTHVLFISMHFPPSYPFQVENPWGCARSMNIFAAREVACLEKMPLWHGSWVTALLTGCWKQSAQTKQRPRLPAQQK